MFIETTFNSISVDGDTSTSDTVVLFATGGTSKNIVTNKIQVSIGNHLVAEQGKTAKSYNEKELKEYMKWSSVDIEVNLNIGSASYTVYTCDFTHDYIDINADYRN